MPNQNITVEVAYALPHRQLIIPLQVAPDSTAEQAIQVSGILAKFPEIDLNQNQIGIFGWPSNYITMGVTFEYLLDFWKP